MTDTIRQRIASKLDSRKQTEFTRFIELYEDAEFSHLPKKLLRKWLSARLGVNISERHFRRMMNCTPT